MVLIPYNTNSIDKVWIIYFYLLTALIKVAVKGCNYFFSGLTRFAWVILEYYAFSTYWATVRCLTACRNYFRGAWLSWRSAKSNMTRRNRWCVHLYGGKQLSSVQKRRYKEKSPNESTVAVAWALSLQSFSVLVSAYWIGFCSMYCTARQGIFFFAKADCMARCLTL